MSTVALSTNALTACLPSRQKDEYAELGGRTLQSVARFDNRGAAASTPTGMAVSALEAAAAATLFNAAAIDCPVVGGAETATEYRNLESSG